MSELEKEWILLSEEIMQRVATYAPPREFLGQTSIVYEGHIPTAGYLIHEGKIDLYKKKKLIKSIARAHTVGVFDLLHNHESQYSFVVHPGSKLSILDKSTLKEIDKDHNLELLLRDKAQAS